MKSTLDLAQKLVQFKTTQGRPSEMDACLRFCEKQFDTRQAEISKYEKDGNKSLIIANTGGIEFDVLLVGHIDTVEGRDELFQGVLSDGRLYGRGSMDMKAFVATSIRVLQAVLDAKMDIRVGLMIVTDEELGGINGAKYLVEEIGLHARVVLVPDDGEVIDQVVSHTKSILHAKVKAKGLEAHGNRPWDGISAIDLIIEAKNNLEKCFPDVRGLKGTQWIESINVGKIKGGTATNEVSGYAEMDVDIRYTEAYQKEDIIERINKSLPENVSYEEVMFSSGVILDKKNDDVKMYFNSIRKVLGSEPRFLQSGGGTDGRYFASRGMTVIAHQGTGGNTQGDREYVEVDSLEKLIEIHLNFIGEQVL